MRRALLAVALLFLVPSLAIAASGPDFRHITSQDGLPYTWVTDICKDSRGYMWFSTIYGAYRYDGSCFKEYSFREGDGLARTTVFQVMEDSRGTIWFCTGAGLYRLEPEKMNSPEAVIHSHSIMSITEDGDGSLWLATRRGISKGSHDGSFVPVPVSGHNSDFGVIAIMCDSGNIVWAGASDGTLLRFDPIGNEFRSVDLSASISASVSCLAEDQGHNIWISTQGDGLWSLNPRSGALRKWCVDNGGLKNDLVRSVTEDKEGNIWAATEKGLVVISPSGGHSFVLSGHSSPKHLNDNATYSVFCDEENNIWVGTFFGGVNLHYSEARLFDSILSSTQEYSADSKVVSTIVPLGEGLMVGTENDGLFLMSEPGGETVHTWTGNSGISGDNIHSVCQDNKGNLWIGTYCNGLSMKHGPRGAFKTFTSDNSALSSDNIYAVFQDSRDNLWVGTQYGGLYRYDYSSSRLERFPKDLPNDIFIWDIHEGRDGNIWLAAFGSGLWKLSVNEGYRAEHIHTPASLYVNICELNDGRFLLGTEKEGLVEFNPHTTETRHIGMEDGLPDDTVYGILQDDEGTLWMSSNSGLIRTDPQCRSFVNYTMADGLPTNRFNYNACRKIGSDLFFGSTDGVVIVRPYMASVPVLTERPVRFSGLLVNGRQVPGEELPAKLVLPWKDNTFSILFSDNIYSLPARKYAYRMQGLNSDWQDIGRGRRIDFLSLRPGRYSLCVAPVTDGCPEDCSSTLQIRILPPWWASVPAKILYILFAVAILVMLLNAAFRKIRGKHEQAMAKLAREKDEEINEIKKQLLLNESSDGQIIRKVADYIYGHSHDNTLSVDTLCSAVGISKTSLYRKMKAVTGLSAVEFIINVRLENAARLLSETDHTISEIAYEVGFSDPYYFSRAFKKVHGCSPKIWREQNMK